MVESADAGGKQVKGSSVAILPENDTGDSRLGCSVNGSFKEAFSFTAESALLADDSVG
jgi:hypothetical protein